MAEKKIAEKSKLLENANYLRAATSKSIYRFLHTLKIHFKLPGYYVTMRQHFLFCSVRLLKAQDRLVITKVIPF